MICETGCCHPLYTTCEDPHKGPGNILAMSYSTTVVMHHPIVIALSNIPHAVT